MNEITYVSKDILRLTTPYKDIFTTVCIIKTDAGTMLFDSASFDTDIEEYILPFLCSAQIGPDALKYVFISHNHTDHAGGLKQLLKYFPDVCIVSDDLRLKEAHPQANFHAPSDGEMLLDVLRVVQIPGHTKDSAAILDTRTGTLISGDCLQLWGIFGSGNWGANIRFPAEHRAAIKRLRKLEISSILAAHDYHPMGFIYQGKEEVSAALDACMEPLLRIERLIAKDPEADDMQICARYNEGGALPTLGAPVVAAVRKDMVNK